MQGWGQLAFDGWADFCWGVFELMDSDDMGAFPKMRRSACAEASLRAEIERVKKMSAVERVSAALEMGELLKSSRGSVKPGGANGEK